MQAKSTHLTNSSSGPSFPLEYIQNMFESPSNFRAEAISQILYHLVASHTGSRGISPDCSSQVVVIFPSFTPAKQPIFAEEWSVVNLITPTHISLNTTMQVTHWCPSSLFRFPNFSKHVLQHVSNHATHQAGQCEGKR